MVIHRVRRAIAAIFAAIVAAIIMIGALAFFELVPTAYAIDQNGLLETKFARAVVSFNSSKLDEALMQLDAILAEQSSFLPALELKALTLKALKRDTEALRIYSWLGRTGPVEAKPKYYYEIATILHRQKRYSQARPYFRAAMRGRFNLGGSHFFLGLMDFEDKQYQTAQAHLRETVASQADDLKPLAEFYLGVIYFREGFSKGAIRGFKDSLELVGPWRASPNAELKKTGEEIASSSRKLLKNYDRARLFGNISTTLQYDSNVALLPGAVTSKAQLDGKSTLKQIIAGGLGVATSSTRSFQLVASYREYFNYNFNSDAKSFDFFSNIGSVYLNYKPYARLTPGIKAEGNFTFQNKAGPNESLEFFPYGLLGDIGGYVRYEILPVLNAQFDASWRPKNFYDDPEKGNDRRSGSGSYFKLSGDYASPWRLLNPAAYVSFEVDAADGRNWQSKTWSLELSNTMKLTARDMLVTSLELAFSGFEDRLPAPRNDDLFSFSALWAHKITPELSWLVDLNFVRNNSDLQTLFAYTRFFGGVGISYGF